MAQQKQDQEGCPSKMMKRREESWSGSLPGGLQGLWTGTGCVLYVTTLTRVLQGRTWKPLLTQEHIHAWINVAKTLQSLPKAGGAVCSALMKPRPNVLATIPREQSHSEAGWGSFPSAGSRAFIPAPLLWDFSQLAPGIIQQNWCGKS